MKAVPEPDKEPILTHYPEPWLAVLTFNRELVRNAISRRMSKLLVERLLELADDEELRALVVTGIGEKAFSAGADLKERRAMTPRQRREHTHEIRQAADLLWTFPVPVVAAIRGFALAGGAELAIACDLRVAGESAIIGFPEVRVGIFPGAGAVERLPRLIGPSKARHLLFTGRQVDADQAFQIGLIDSVVPDAYLMTEAVRLARDIASQSASAVRALKQALLSIERDPPEQARQRVEQIRGDLDDSADYDVGLEAFAEGRAPKWLDD